MDSSRSDPSSTFEAKQEECDDLQREYIWATCLAQTGGDPLPCQQQLLLDDGSVRLDGRTTADERMR